MSETPPPVAPSEPAPADRCQVILEQLGRVAAEFLTAGLRLGAAKAALDAGLAEHGAALKRFQELRTGVDAAVVALAQAVETVTP